MKLISKFHSTKAIQNLSLLSGLGLLTPSVEFWEPVGINTANMVLEDKINLLAYLVPRFGSGNAHQEAALTAFATGLEPTMSVVRTKCPDLSASDVELLGTELLCAEILIPGRSSKEEFATWLGSLNDADLKAILASRKSSNEETASELSAYRKQLEEEKLQLEELKKRYNEQVQKAREERTMAFNPNTGKFQLLKKKD